MTNENIDMWVLDDDDIVKNLETGEFYTREQVAQLALNDQVGIFNQINEM